MKRYLPNPIQIPDDVNKSVNKCTNPIHFSKSFHQSTFPTLTIGCHLVDLPMTHSDANEQTLFVPPPWWQKFLQDFMEGKAPSFLGGII